MNYFFILGNNPTLSVAEIVKKFESTQAKWNWISREVFVLETNSSTIQYGAGEEINARELIKEIGGTIKIGEIKETAKPSDLKSKIIEQLEEKSKKTDERKFKFGISFYGEKWFDVKDLAMDVKKEAKEYGLHCKWAGGRDKNLSSVTVEKNKLIGKGLEIVLIEDCQGNYVIGQTLAVQPFEALSFRDYGRPARDDFSGMIPPKLAQIMLNLAGIKDKKAVILDPFCGSGTILTEAMLMGYKNLIGTDVSAKAVNDTKKNIQWTVEKFGVENLKCKIYEKEAEKISGIVKNNSIDAIITEPFLGPQRGKINQSGVKSNLERMYEKALEEFYKILKPGGKVAMIWPIFPVRKGDFSQNAGFLSLKLRNFKIAKLLPEELTKNPNAILTKRGTIIYGRKNQRVWREIVVLEVKK